MVVPKKQIRLNKRDTSEIIKRDPLYRETLKSMRPSTEGLPTQVFDNRKGVPSPSSQGLRLPNGNMFQGSAEEEAVVRRFFQKRKLAADKEASDRARVQESMNYDRLKKQMEAEATPQNVTPEQLAQIGQAPGIGGEPNELTADIQQNIERRRRADLLAGTQGTDFEINAPFLNPAKYTSAATQIPYVGGIIKFPLSIFTQNNEDLRDFLVEDYSNERNFGRVKDNLGLAKRKLNMAITLANKPGDIEASQEAITGYNRAIAQINLSLAQMKEISQSDQREYSENVKDEIILTEKYLTENVYGPGGLNDRFAAALAKPNPNYFNEQMAGTFEPEGVSNFGD